jgi:hypothetical protein
VARLARDQAARFENAGVEARAKLGDGSTNPGGRIAARVDAPTFPLDRSE